MNTPYIHKLYEDIMEDDTLPPFSERQWDALCGDTEMTQKLYNEILDLCCKNANFAEYYEIRQNFPELNAAHNKHFAEKYDFVPTGKFGGILEFEQFDFILQRFFRENDMDIDDSRILGLLDEMCH